VHALHRAIVAVTVAVISLQAAQPEDTMPVALQQMLAAERSLASRAADVGWRQAFLERLAPGAIGFANGAPGLARRQLGDLAAAGAPGALEWEPRLGDSAASGELGYLIGPMRGERAPGTGVHAAYLHVWKRQRNGRFRLALNVATPTPAAPPFEPGFTRAPATNRFTEYDESTPPLGTADGVLNAAVRSDQSRGYRSRLTADARFHRPGTAPLVGEARIMRWLETQPAFDSADTRYSEAARSGDLGYTWGTYASLVDPSDRGVYVRIWVRERDGQWHVALDALEAQ
jgi:ketosteroid isomerase-like protein